MSDYKVSSNFIFFKELFKDTFGTNHRCAEIKERKADKLSLVTKIHDFISKDEEVWKRVKILLEGINKSKIPNLYSPQRIIESPREALLVFNYMNAQSMDNILKKAAQNNTPLTFDLAFSIIASVADIIDMGSSIVVSRQKSFHGLLTPENILIDYNGKIFLKNYGIMPFLNRNHTSCEKIVEANKNILPYELVNKEKISIQTDIYMLGFLVYKMLTGKDFTIKQGETAEQKINSTNFSQYLPYNDESAATNLSVFFKKTLNADPSKRFASIRDFKEFVSNAFHIEELSSVTFNLAYFMNSLYSEEIDSIEGIIAKELEYTLPEPKKEEVKEESSELVESILSGLDDNKSSKPKALIPIVAGIVIVIAVVGFYMYNQFNKKIEIMELQRKAETRKNLQKQAAERKKAEQQRADDEAARLKLQKELEDYKKTTQMNEEKKQKMAEKQAELKKLEQKKNEDFDKFLKEADTLIAQNNFTEALKYVDMAEKIKTSDKITEYRNKITDIQNNKKKADLAKQKEEARIAEEKRIDNLASQDKPLPLKYVDQTPSKVSGELPRSIQKKFSDTGIEANILIDKQGNVTRVKIITNVPAESKMEIIRSLDEWKFKPAKRKNINVSVWFKTKIL